MPQRNMGINNVRPAIDRFMTKVCVEPNGCWQWIGALDTGGYAQFYDVKNITGHRWSYQHFVGPIPEGLTLDHLCRNRGCVNPEHLDPVPQRINVRRGTSLAAQYAKATHCVNGHEFTPENTRERSDHKGRVCIACQAAASRRSAKRQKLARNAWMFP